MGGGEPGDRGTNREAAVRIHEVTRGPERETFGASVERVGLTGVMQTRAFLLFARGWPSAAGLSQHCHNPCCILTLGQ